VQSVVLFASSKQAAVHEGARIRKDSGLFSFAAQAAFPNREHRFPVGEVVFPSKENTT
jgi:hypothetical protein